MHDGVIYMQLPGVMQANYCTDTDTTTADRSTRPTMRLAVGRIFNIDIGVVVKLSVWVVARTRVGGRET